MDIHELRQLLVESGIATQEQGEALLGVAQRIEERKQSERDQALDVMLNGVPDPIGKTFRQLFGER